PSLATQNGIEGQSVSLNMQATDHTGTDALTYSASHLPAGLSLNVNTGMIAGMLALDVAGISSPIVYGTAVTLTDNHGGSDTRSFNWAVSTTTLMSGTEGQSIAVDVIDPRLS